MKNHRLPTQHRLPRLACPTGRWVPRLACPNRVSRTAERASGVNLCNQWFQKNNKCFLLYYRAISRMLEISW